jgi:hypothetical protein
MSSLRLFVTFKTCLEYAYTKYDSILVILLSTYLMLSIFTSSCSQGNSTMCIVSTFENL